MSRNFFGVDLFNKTDLKEKALTIFIFTGIFLPVRLFFYTFVSTWWLGSFGLITGIMLTMLYFARKNKLGFIGRIVNKQVTRISKGRAGLSTIILSIFFLYSFGNVLYGIAYPPEKSIAEFTTEFEKEGVTDLKTLAASPQTHKLTPTDLLLVLPLGILVMIIPTEPGHALFAIINIWTNGWFAHFMTVFFVQLLEILGLVIYFRYFYKPSLVLSDH